MAEIVIRLLYRAANGKIEDAQQDYGLETFGGFLPAVGDQVLDPGAAAGVDRTACQNRRMWTVVQRVFMRDLAKHIVNQKAADFEPDRFEDHYEEALTELINAKRQGKTLGPKPRPRGENVVDLMDALKKSIATEASAKKPRKAAAGQKEMLLPIEGKKPAAKKAAKSERATGRRKTG